MLALLNTSSLAIYSNDNRPTSQNDISGISITDVADHFGTFHIFSKCKQTPVQTYSQIRQMKTDNISKFNNILTNADYSSVLLDDCPNYAYHSFMEIYTNAFNRACPVKSIKTPKNILSSMSSSSLWWPMCSTSVLSRLGFSPCLVNNSFHSNSVSCSSCMPFATRTRSSAQRSFFFQSSC